MTGHDPDDRGDDTDGTPEDDADSPAGWPDDWTTADEDVQTTDESSSHDDESSTLDNGSSTPDDDAVADDAGGRTGEGAEGDVDADDPTAADETAADTDSDATTEDIDANASTENADGDATTANVNAAPVVDESNPGTASDSTIGDRTEPEKPPAPNVDDDAPTIEDDGFLTWFMNTPNGMVVLARDVLSSVAAVAAIGLILFAISGIWPPLVAVESGSMEPHMSKGDLVFIVDEHRYAPQSAIAETGVSTYASAQEANGYWKFGNYGDVVVYRPYGNERATPIIHRARFYVEEGDNWVQEADPAHMGSIDSCAEVPRNMCPAPYDGFITKGDANTRYDQVGDQSTIVKPEWVRGKAEVRVPLLGWIRLQFAKLAVAGPNAFGPLGALGLRFGALGLAGSAGFLSLRL